MHPAFATLRAGLDVGRGLYSGTRCEGRGVPGVVLRASGANAHTIDVYRPVGDNGSCPTLLWSTGQAWRNDEGNRAADAFAAALASYGIAVADISVRSSPQATQERDLVHAVAGKKALLATVCLKLCIDGSAP